MTTCDNKLIIKIYLYNMNVQNITTVNVRKMCLPADKKMFDNHGAKGVLITTRTSIRFTRPAHVLFASALTDPAQNDGQTRVHLIGSTFAQTRPSTDYYIL